jgi:long-chain fatty acid transport protein
MDSILASTKSYLTSGCFHLISFLFRKNPEEGYLMMRTPCLKKKSTYLALMALIVSQAGFAGGFSLYTEGSAVDIGNFAAGSAAEASDASIGWYNPAGLVLLKKDQFLLSGVGVFPRNSLTGTSTYNTLDVPSYEQSFRGLHGNQDAIVPALHYAHPLGERAVFGFSLLSPFGLSTDWGETSPVRYAATLTGLTTINASPEMGASLTDHLAMGAGLDLQWAQVKFNGMAGSPAALEYLQSLGSPVTATTFDSSSINQGESFGVGFHAGLLGHYHHDQTRVGLNYQSSIRHRFTGTSTLTGRLADLSLTNPEAIYSTDDLMSNDIGLPNIVTLSGYQALNAQWALLGSVVYSGWSIFQTTALYNVAGYSVESGLQSPLNIITPQNYRDTWRFAAGTNYQVTEQWMIRAGGGYDQTPTVDGYRDIRLPDANRWALSLGTHYQITPALGMDMGYTYLFATGEVPINTTQVLDVLSSVQVAARALNHAQLAGIQAVWTFDRAKETK